MSDIRPNSSGKQEQSTPEFDWDDNEYDFTHSKRGRAIIINNEKFLKMRFREGSSKDAEDLCETFELLGFDVECRKDLKAEDMKKFLQETATNIQHDESADCFVCVILTHGGVEEISDENDASISKKRHDVLYGSDDEYIKTKDAVDIFCDENCGPLKDKPRLFFIQACRGKNCDDGVKVLVKMPDQGEGHTDPRHSQGDIQLGSQSDVKVEPDVDVENPVVHVPAYKDCLIMYSTPPGYRSWRNESKGAWFIQSLCKVLKDVSTSIPLQSRLTRVNHSVAHYYQSQNEDFPSKKEMPIIYSGLMKDVQMSRKQSKN